MLQSVLKSRLSTAACLVLLASIALASSARAQGGAAPAMYGVEEVVVHLTRFGNEKSAQSCGLSQEDLAATLEKTLKSNGVPAILAADAKPPMTGVVRVELAPEIFSFNSQGLDCTSWISLTAETHNSLHVPPVDLSRNITVVYWREGTMLSSVQTTHASAVDDAVQKLARQFAQQYKLDQPAPASSDQ